MFAKKWILYTLLFLFIFIFCFYFFNSDGNKDVKPSKYNSFLAKNIESRPLFTKKEINQLKSNILLSLHVGKYKFLILVYAWKRRASLKRLMDSLVNVNYRGFTVNLEFHIEGDPHPLCSTIH